MMGHFVVFLEKAALSKIWCPTVIDNIQTIVHALYYTAWIFQRYGHQYELQRHFLKYV